MIFKRSHHQDYAVVNSINHHQARYLSVAVALVISAVLFATACSASSQETSSQNKPESTQTAKPQPELPTENFKNIQTALRSLDESLAAQSMRNKDIQQSDPALPSDPPPMNDSMNGKMKMSKGMGMGMGMDKNMMSGKSCKGMMCKMMMKNGSMMGTPPQQNTPETVNSPSTISLPGTTGAPHIYHVGEQAFFLNYNKTLELTDSQYQTLLAVQTEWGSVQKSITQQRSALEASLWELTAQGRPQYNSIKDTISKIEASNSALRLQFITLVGKAVAVLTPLQIEKVKTLWMTAQKDEL